MKCPNCQADLAPEGGCPQCGWAGSLPEVSAADWPELPADHVVAGRFVVEQALDLTPGRSMRVYLARDPQTGKAVTVKEALSATPAAQRLRREHDILGAVSHPAILRALALAGEGDATCLVLERPQALPLSEAWKQEGIDRAQQLDWLARLCDALDALHSGDIVCLGVHPERVVVTEQNELLLVDFSNARRLPIPPGERLTGPEFYAAPEVFLAPQEVTLRADIYGLGAAWYALELGRPLRAEQFDSEFVARPPVEVMPGLSPALNRIIARAVHRMPARRQKSVLYIKDALEELKRQLGRQPCPTVGVCSDTGMVREANEDSCLAEESVVGGEGSAPLRCGLYLVSDGMGGEAGGVIASRTTVEVLREALWRRLKDFSPQEAEQDQSAEIHPLLQAAINRASAAVHQRASADPLLRKMGATVVVAVLLGRHLYVANVGDSRAYLIKPDGMKQITRDHTVIADLIERGELDAGKAADHPAQGQLTRNIGARAQVEGHLAHYEPGPGALVLLCSDGLNDRVEDEEIRARVTGAPSRQGACDQLVNLANGRGSPDNVTVVLTGIAGGQE